MSRSWCVTPFVLLGDLFGNRGPLFYRQPRDGGTATTFEILKFRTMRGARPRRGQTGPRSTTSASRPSVASCVARTSTSCRRCSTSCEASSRSSGPGPSSPTSSPSSSDKIPFYGLRHLVRPGLTGWAQVKYQYAGNEAETLEKLQYEFFYLRRQSLGLDLRIVGRTARSVVGRERPVTQLASDSSRVVPDPTSFRTFLRSAGKLAVARQLSGLVFVAAVLALPTLTSRSISTDFVWSYFAMLTLTSLLGLGLERLAEHTCRRSGGRLR